MHDFHDDPTALHNEHHAAGGFGAYESAEPEGGLSRRAVVATLAAAGGGALVGAVLLRSRGSGGDGGEAVAADFDSSVENNDSESPVEPGQTSFETPSLVDESRASALVVSASVASAAGQAASGTEGGSGSTGTGTGTGTGGGSGNPAMVVDVSGAESGSGGTGSPLVVDAGDSASGGSSTGGSSGGGSSQVVTPGTGQSSSTPTPTPLPAEPVAFPVLAEGFTDEGLTPNMVATRLAYGMSPDLANDLNAMGINGWIADQLTKTGPDPAVDSRFPGNSPVKADRNAFAQVKDPERKITHSNVLRARYSKHQLYEKVVAMWMDHFNVNLEGREHRYLAEYQEDVIRPHAMGRFADLLQATAESPAMMIYLDNALSDARKEINENYGREILELHSVGDGNHSEADMVSAAKILSGRTVTGRFPKTFEFNAQMHANETVTVLGREFPAGGGKQQGDDLIQFLATHPDTARMVAYKIGRRFVSDEPPASLIESAAQVYLDSDTAIVPVLNHVFASPEFAASAGEKLRRPFEYFIAALRATDAQVPNDEDRQMVQYLDQAGHRPWYWGPPDGYPDDAPYWADTSGFLVRWRFAGNLCRNELDKMKTNITGLRSQVDTAGAYVNEIARRAALGQLPEADVTAILESYDLNAGSPAGEINDNAAADIAALVLCHPSFQLR